MISPFDRIGYVEHNSGYRNCNSSSTSIRPRRRLYSGFFIKPHLYIESKLVKYPVKIQATRTGPQLTKEEFDVIVWTIQVVNRFPRISLIVNKCSARMYLDLVSEEIELGWRSSQGEPTSVRLHYSDEKPPVNATPRDKFSNRLGAEYADWIVQHRLKNLFYRYKRMLCIDEALCY